jgi:hypothetical protein
MSAHLKMKTEDIKFIFVSVVFVFSLACCISITKAAVSETIDTGNQEKEVIVEHIEEPEATKEEPVVSAEDKDCDKALESIQEQSANIDEGMAEIKRDLEELKKRKKKKKITKKKIKKKKVIDK